MLYKALQVAFFALGLAATVVVLVSLQSSRNVFLHLVRDTAPGERAAFFARVEEIREADWENGRWVKLWYIVMVVSWVFVGMGKYKLQREEEPKSVKYEE